MPIKTGHRLADAEPTVPTVTLSPRAGRQPHRRQQKERSCPISSSTPRQRHDVSPSALPSSLASFPSCDVSGAFACATIVPCNFRASRLPDFLVLADVFQRGVERADPVRHADQVRMQRNCHHSAGFGAFAVEHVELIADHLAEAVGADIARLDRRFVVELLGVRHRDDRTSVLQVIV